MDALSAWSNQTEFHDVKHVLQHQHHKSSLARFLFSYDSVNKVYTPILLLFGAIGNCLSVTVFCHAPSHRHLSSSFYLSALAISDIGYLINLLAVWLEDMGFRVITSELTCPLVMYLGQVTCFLSVWLTVSFTAERFFAVCYPLTRPTVCTVARAKKVITILTIISIIGFSYVWLIARVVHFPIIPPSLPQDEGESTEGQDELDIFDNPDLTHNFTLLPSNCNTSRMWHTFGGTPGPHSTQSVGGTRTGHKVGIFSLDLSPCNSSYRNSSRMATSTLARSSTTPAAVSSLSSESPVNVLLEPPHNSSFNKSGYEDGPGLGGGETVAFCYVREDYTYFSSIASYIDSLLTLILPFFIISYLNIRIALCVWKLKDERQNIVAVAKISTSAYQQPSQQQQQQQPQMSDHPSSSSIATNTTTCRLTVSRSSPVLNGCVLMGGGQPSPTSATSLTNSKSYRINLASSTTSLNTVNTTNVNGPFSSSSAGVGGVGGGGRLHRNHHHHSSTSTSEARVTKTLLLVSTVFLVLNLPAHAIRALVFIRSLWELEMLEELQAAQAWANILFNTNFSCNFLLYCMSGRTFRKSLWSIFFKSKSSSSSRQPKTGGGLSGVSKKKNLFMLHQNNRTNHHHHNRGQQQQQQQYNRPYPPGRLGGQEEEEEGNQTIIITPDPRTQEDILNNDPQIHSPSLHP